MMTKVRRWTSVLLGVVLAGSVGACGIDDGGDPLAACTDETRSAGEPGDAEPLLVLGDAGFSPTVVYADGAVVVPTSEDVGAAAVGHLRLPLMAPGYMGDQPGGFTAGSLTDCQLEVVIERADALFVEGVDFGSPTITDQGSTQVSYRGDSVSIYAFSRSDPTEGGGLSGSQSNARQDLADLWDSVQDAAQLTGEVEPERLFVHVFAPVDEIELIDWPLDVPLSEIVDTGDSAVVTDPEQVDLLLDRVSTGEPMSDPDWDLAVMVAAPGLPSS